MFDIGMPELIVIFIVALLVFGPKRLPELGRNIGKGLAELKKAMQGVKDEMDSEIRKIDQQALSGKQPGGNEGGVIKPADQTGEKTGQTGEQAKSSDSEKG